MVTAVAAQRGAGGARSGTRFARGVLESNKHTTAVRKGVWRVEIDEESLMCRRLENPRWAHPMGSTGFAVDPVVLLFL